MALTRDVVEQAYEDVLGRKAGDGDVNFGSGFRTRAELQQALASSDEARKKKVDPTKFGTEFVDPGSLSDREREWYDVWKKNKGSQKITKWELSNWMRNSRSKEWMDLELGGKMGTIGLTDGRVAKVLDKDALGQLGFSGDYFYSTKGDSTGDVVLIPENFKTSKRWTRVADGKDFGDKYAGYQVLQLAAREKSGIAGKTVKALGGSKALANKMDRAAGKASLLSEGYVAGLGGSDELSAIVGGTRGYRARQDTVRRMAERVGLKGQDTLEFMDKWGNVGQDVVAVVVDSGFGGAPVGSSSRRATQAWAAESVGADVQWDKVGTQIGVMWATYGAAKGLEKGLSSGPGAKLTGGQRAIAYKTGTTATAYGAAKAQGQSDEEALASAGRSLVASSLPDDPLIGAAFSYAWATGVEGRKSDEAMTAAGLGMGGSLLKQSASGQRDQTTMWERWKAQNLNVSAESLRNRGAFWQRRDEPGVERTADGSMYSPVRRKATAGWQENVRRLRAEFGSTEAVK